MADERADGERLISLPEHARDIMVRLRKAHPRLKQKEGRLPTLGELAAEADVPDDKVIDALLFAAEPRWLWALPDEHSDTENAEPDGMADDHAQEPAAPTADTVSSPSEIARLLAPLSEREREAIKRAYYGGSAP